MRSNPSEERKETLDALRQALASDPTNLPAADRYWKALGKSEGHDLRNGRIAVEVYRPSALASQQGAVALSQAFKELFNASGEAPRATYFDEDLTRALEQFQQTTIGDERAILDWLLGRINQGG